MKCLNVVLLWMLGVAIAAASDVQPVNSVAGSGPGQGLVAIICPTGTQGERFVSRGFAIARHPSAPFDIVLAARHAGGSAQDSDFTHCQIRAGGGEYRAIAATRQTAEYHDEGDDWVILRTAEPLPETVTRFGLARARAAAGQLPDIAILASRIGQACEIRNESVRSGQGALFAHDCDTRPGQSGSPIIISLNGQPTVIGIHVGQLLEFSAGQQRAMGVGRWIDASIEQAVMDLAHIAD